MFLSALKQFNWVDIFVVIIILRIGYVALRNGFSLELFKLLGTVLAIYLSLHYYLVFSDNIAGRLSIDNNIAREYLTFLFFIFLAVAGYAIFVILRKVFYRFIQLEAVANLNKWGGLFLGLCRAVLALSLLVCLLVTSPIAYLKNSVASSYSGKYLSKAAPAVYSALWNGIACKFMLNEKFNQAVLEIPGNFTPKE